MVSVFFKITRDGSYCRRWFAKKKRRIKAAMTTIHLQNWLREPVRLKMIPSQDWGWIRLEIELYNRMFFCCCCCFLLRFFKHVILGRYCVDKIFPLIWQNLCRHRSYRRWECSSPPFSFCLFHQELGYVIIIFVSLPVLVAHLRSSTVVFGVSWKGK